MPESIPPTTGRESRWQFRLRVHIATLFLMVMTAAGLAIIGYGYRATSRLLLSAGDDEFLHVAERTADHVRALLGPARPTRSPYIPRSPPSTSATRTATSSWCAPCPRASARASGRRQTRRSSSRA